ncbi:MAG: response regulator transcription factor [Patescibacteria group bacterium]|nr:response regulator transcription factor [Patescibacteria group bacterium]
MKILIVEDEAPIREVEAAYLKRAGYDVAEAATGPAALELFEQSKFDLIVLDLNLPGLSGLEVCRRIRADSLVPIIMLTARAEDTDELLGLDLGADDYIKKPFKPPILVARAQALLRRHAPARLEFKDIAIEPAAMRVTQNNRAIALTTTQFNILLALAKQPGQVLTRDQLLDQSYDDPAGHAVFDRTIDAHIKAIRKALEPDPAHPVYIQTVIGRGYRFREVGE